jgi:hypothetical protein
MVAGSVHAMFACPPGRNVPTYTARRDDCFWHSSAGNPPSGGQEVPGVIPKDHDKGG